MLVFAGLLLTASSPGGGAYVPILTIGTNIVRADREIYAHERVNP